MKVVAKNIGKLSFLALALSTVLVACKDKEKKSEADPAVDDGQAPKTAPATSDTGATSAWEETSADALSAEEREMLERAKSAQKRLGGTLIKALTEAVAEDGFAAGIEVCNTAAPEIAQTVRRDTGVEIGRTSFKLRNPKNTAPTWAEPYVAERVAEPTVLRSDDKLAYLAPIKMGEMCVNCHGPKDQLAEGVSEKLDKLYPKDQATGFEAGDLRGWFWVEVPES